MAASMARPGTVCTTLATATTGRSSQRYHAARRPSGTLRPTPTISAASVICRWPPR